MQKRHERHAGGEPGEARDLEPEGPSEPAERDRQLADEI